jgi:hypothetical protein
MTIFWNCKHQIFYQQGTKDAASRRSISTVMSKLTRNVVHPHDDLLLLKHRMEDNQRMSIGQSIFDVLNESNFFVLRTVISKEVCRM